MHKVDTSVSMPFALITQEQDDIKVQIDTDYP